MDSKNATQAYLSASVENAPPVQIIRLLYQGALRFLGQAMIVELPKEGADFNDLLNKVDDIVVELRLALEYGPKGSDEIPRNLERLYLFCEDELGRALVEQSQDPLPAIKQVLEVLLDAWRNVEIDSRKAA